MDSLSMSHCYSITRREDGCQQAVGLVECRITYFWHIIQIGSPLADQ
jgi:hypothetical protein